MTLTMFCGFGDSDPPTIGHLKRCGDGLHIIPEYDGGTCFCVCGRMRFSVGALIGGPINVVIPDRPRFLKLDFMEEAP
jgi:hypothetical protein